MSHPPKQTGKEPDGAAIVMQLSRVQAANIALATAGPVNSAGPALEAKLAHGTISVELHPPGDGMALNIKDRATEKLAAEVAAITGESKTRAVRVALEERKQRLALRIGRRDRAQEIRRFLEQEVWPALPRGVRGKRVSRREREVILGYGRSGV